jgi:hypothetical protein
MAMRPSRADVREALEALEAPEALSLGLQGVAEDLRDRVTRRRAQMPVLG